MKSMIVAYDKHRAIGKEGGRPWEGGKLQADMRRFRELTRGKTIIMGRNTFETDIGGHALPNRQNIVLSRTPIQVSGVQWARSLPEAYALATDEIAIIGGGQIYKEALPDAEFIYATEIHGDIHGDTFFPELDENWHEVSREDFPADDKNAYPYSFVTYTRKQLAY